METIEQVVKEMQVWRHSNPYSALNCAEMRAFRARMGLPNGVSYRPEKITEPKDQSVEAAERRNNDWTYFGINPVNIRKAFFTIRIRLLNRERAIGVRSAPRLAGNLFDSALFYCWSFADRPRVNKFNFYVPGEKCPELLPEVERLRDKLQIESGCNVLDFLQSP